MPGIFISYRRDDSQGFAGRLADDLTEIFGAQLVFRDVEIPVGQDFTDVINRAIAAADVLLVVIGRDWLAASTRSASSRLFDPIDWVRAEIEAALIQKEIVPVLVAGAAMVSRDELPEGIRSLANIQAQLMNDRRWDYDVEQLANVLRSAVSGLNITNKDDSPAPADTPARVLRDLGDRVFDEIQRQRQTNRRQRSSGYSRVGGSLWRSLGTSLLRSMKKIIGSAVLIAAVYFGLRLFGDQEMQQLLNALEDRLELGWQRLLNYVETFR